MGVHRGLRRMPMREAAQVLGVSKDAIRQRIRRGTIRSEKGEDGRVYVFVDASSDTVHDPPRQSTSLELVDELRDRVAFLERELERKDAILLNMTEAMKAISPPVHEEAPQEPPEAPVTATPQSGRVEPQPEVEGPQEATAQPQRRSWWREFFGFD